MAPHWNISKSQPNLFTWLIALFSIQNIIYIIIIHYIWNPRAPKLFKRARNSVVLNTIFAYLLNSFAFTLTHSHVHIDYRAKKWLKSSWNLRTVCRHLCVVHWNFRSLNHNFAKICSTTTTTISISTSANFVFFLLFAFDDQCAQLIDLFFDVCVIF